MLARSLRLARYGRRFLSSESQPHLDDAQRKFVNAGPGVHIVHGESGSGKSFALAARATHLLAKKKPCRVLALHTSKVAAARFQHKVDQDAPIDSRSSMESVSIYAFAWRIVKEYAEELGLPKGFHIAPWSACLEHYLEHVMVDAQSWKQIEQRSIRGRLAVFAALRECDVQPEAFSKVAAAKYLPDGIAELYTDHLEQSVADGVLHWSHVSYLALRLMEITEIRKEVCAAYDHIFVDELESFSRAQVRLVHSVMGSSLSMAVDERQSLNGFAGSVALRDTLKSFKDGATLHRLKHAHRGDIELHSLAHRLLSGGTQSSAYQTKLGKELVLPEHPSGTSANVDGNGISNNVFSDNLGGHVGSGTGNVATGVRKVMFQNVENEPRGIAHLVRGLINSSTCGGVATLTAKDTAVTETILSQSLGRMDARLPPTEGRAPTIGILVPNRQFAWRVSNEMRMLGLVVNNHESSSDVQTECLLFVSLIQCAKELYQGKGSTQNNLTWVMLATSSLFKVSASDIVRAHEAAVQDLARTRGCEPSSVTMYDTFVHAHDAVEAVVTGSHNQSHKSDQRAELLIAQQALCDMVSKVATLNTSLKSGYVTDMAADLVKELVEEEYKNPPTDSTFDYDKSADRLLFIMKVVMNIEKGTGRGNVVKLADATKVLLTTPPMHKSSEDLYSMSMGVGLGIDMWSHDGLHDAAVHVMNFERAKHHEFDAVVVAGLAHSRLPAIDTPADIRRKYGKHLFEIPPELSGIVVDAGAELTPEDWTRRLLYVGITKASHLAVVVCVKMANSSISRILGLYPEMCGDCSDVDMDNVDGNNVSMDESAVIVDGDNNVGDLVVQQCDMRGLSISTLSYDINKPLLDAVNGGWCFSPKDLKYFMRCPLAFACDHLLSIGSVSPPAAPPASYRMTTFAALKTVLKEINWTTTMPDADIAASVGAGEYFTYREWLLEMVQWTTAPFRLDDWKTEQWAKNALRSRLVAELQFKQVDLGGGLKVSGKWSMVLGHLSRVQRAKAASTDRPTIVVSVNSPKKVTGARVQTDDFVFVMQAAYMKQFGAWPCVRLIYPQQPLSGNFMIKPIVPNDHRLQRRLDHLVQTWHKFNRTKLLEPKPNGKFCKLCPLPIEACPSKHI